MADVQLGGDVSTGTKPFSLSVRQEGSAFSDPEMCWT